MSARPLTTTSYAILGLLSLRSWTTYELAQQMTRSLRFYWPRAESNLYEEPKNLVTHGLAAVQQEHTGRRPRAVYSITPAGREALASWLSHSGDPAPVLEFEAMVRVAFAESGTREQLLDVLRSIRELAAEWEEYNVTRAREYLATGGPFPERLHLIALVSQFVYDYRGMIGRWAAWAEREVAGWPSMQGADKQDLARRVFAPLVGGAHARSDGRARRGARATIATR